MSPAGPKAAFIGLGAMGEPMARNLHAAGLLAAVHSRSRDKTRRIAGKLGVADCAQPAEVLAHAELVFLCVPADAEVLALVDALCAGPVAGKLVVDTSTVRADTALQAAERLRKAGAAFMDAPITGGTEGARNAGLTFMVGASAEDLARARPALEAMGRRIVHLGPVGSGQRCKAVNQVMCAGINQAVVEGLAFAEALGLPLERVIEATGSGAAGSWFLDHRGPTMIRDRYQPGFRVALHRKDLQICLAMAQQLGTSLPLVERTVADYAALIEAGHGDEDISALYRLRGRHRRAR